MICVFNGSDEDDAVKRRHAALLADDSESGEDSDGRYMTIHSIANHV